MRSWWLLRIPAVGAVAASLALAAGCGRPAEEIADGRPPLRAEASVDRSTATIGDLVRYTVEVEYEADLAVAESDPVRDLGGLEVVESGRNALRTVRGRAGLVDWWLLRAPGPGSYVLPPLAVEASDASGGTVSVATDEVFVDVVSVLPEDGSAEDIRDLKPLEPEPRWWPWIVGLMVVVLALLLAPWLRRRLTARRERSVRRLPHEVAFEELEALRRTDFDDPEQLRLYHFGLSAVIRRYVEDRFGLNATDLTREEIAERVRGIPLDADLRRRLLEFLASTDDVKYAARVPSEGQIEAVYEQALTFIEDTVPSEEPDAEEDAGNGRSGAEGDGPRATGSRGAVDDGREAP